MSGQGSDLARLTLLRGIRIETRNAGVYNSLSQLFEGYDESVVAIFREMAEEERQHEADLVRRYEQRYGRVPSPGDEPKEVIEAPDLEDSEALIFDSMTVRQALEAGLKAELMAREFYRREVAGTRDLELQKAYRELAEFEEDHVRRLEQKLAEIGHTKNGLVR